MKYLILGGGITGLSAAWYLKKRDPEAEITLLERQNRLGGWIQTSYEGGFLFEKGPRTFQIGRSFYLLEMIRELELEIVASDPSANRRFILHNGKLRSSTSFLPRLIPYLIRECLMKPRGEEDESIYDFASRRFSPKIAELLFDPLTLGVYAGDIRKLSIRSCFPMLQRWEKEKGSIVKGFFSSKKQQKGLFTLKGGMQTLVDTLQKRLNIHVVLNANVETIKENEVTAMGKTWQADRILSALPLSVPHRSIWVVHMGFDRAVLPKKGFGYLVPTKEKELLLGCIFDSMIFPDRTQKTRLTLMIRAEDEKPLQTASSCLERHLGIRIAPIYSCAFFAKDAIAQFEVGCGCVENISVDGCIQRGKKLSESSQ